MVTCAAFAVAAVWIIMSAARHSTAQTNCEGTYFPTAAVSGTSTLGQTMCNIFPWVDVGLMAGAWVFFAVTQVCVCSAAFLCGLHRHDSSISMSSFRRTERVSVKIMKSTNESMIQRSR